MNDTLWIHHARPRSNWYRLPENEQHALLARWSAVEEQATANGAVHVGNYAVRGQSDFATVDIWKFATPEDIHGFWERKVAADYAVWFAFANQIGVTIPADSGQA
ncbi:hypothetical protein M1247_12655 [Mycobacterium sp. 21AC1]|uniref:hypothetical protein n=1 Tax=[Mycobacterium] appelbergii TaxID=2939269 RepID=UPI0029390327|nr:hypothetical protein [Mycobacterium sp. 21AC1]MDV3125770.1 hypothetical protein [Mycobacterium sp. 21AC1]